MLKADYKKILRECLFDDEGQPENEETIDLIAGRFFEVEVDWLPSHIAKSAAEAIMVQVEDRLRAILEEYLLKFRDEMKVKNEES